MEPTGLLMIEHRLIERMLELIRRETKSAEKKDDIDAAFLDAAVDFIRWYADKTHHAKEEAILFRDVGEKEISPADRRLMQELIEDHGFGRNTVGQLVAAKEAFLQGSRASLKTILDTCETLIAFYQQHIYKEDRIFFPASMKYLTEEEHEAMLENFRQSDRKMIHAKYGAVVGDYERKMK